MSDFVTVAWVATAYFQPECPDTLHLDESWDEKAAQCVKILATSGHPIIGGRAALRSKTLRQR